VRAVVGATRLKYIIVLTHGGMLTVERARSLRAAGVNQFNISLDYLDERQDVARGIPGLSSKILGTVAGMRAAGMDGIRFNTVIKRDNVAEIMPIVRRAMELGCGVNLSVYTDAKNGNREHLLGDGTHGQLDALVAELLAFKRAHRGVITNSDYYIEQIPRYVRGEMTEPCHSGLRTIHVNPTGHVKRCPDFPADFHWREFRRYAPVSCNACYYACRGEAQAPLRLSRVADVLA
jgi:MoaA/NifB/PqqE/SkfB family radical SAM enzyme